MKNYYIKLTINDPYPKHYESTDQGSNVAIAVKRAIQKFRKEKWQRRPLKEISIYAKAL